MGRNADSSIQERTKGILLLPICLAIGGAASGQQTAPMRLAEVSLTAPTTTNQGTTANSILPFQQGPHGLKSWRPSPDTASTKTPQIVQNFAITSTTTPWERTKPTNGILSCTAAKGVKTKSTTVWSPINLVRGRSAERVGALGRMSNSGPTTSPDGSITLRTTTSFTEGITTVQNTFLPMVSATVVETFEPWCGSFSTDLRLPRYRSNKRLFCFRIDDGLKVVVIAVPTLRCEACSLDR
jgi:hypothetical protein